MRKRRSGALPIGFSWFLAGLLGVLAAPPISGQTVRGLLLSRDTQAPIALGRVTLLGEDSDSLAATLSDDNGFFSLTAPEGGTYRVVGSALGYRGAIFGPYEVDDEGMQVIQLLLGPRPIPLPGVVVSAERLAEPEVATLVATGFYDRLAEGRGEFLTPGEIARSTIRHTPQLFREMTTVELLPVGRSGASAPWNDRVMLRRPPGDLIGQTLEEQRARSQDAMDSRSLLEGDVCAPRVFVDGVQLHMLPTESLADAVPKSEIEAVEVYQGPFGAPMEYQGTYNCGVVLFWTRGR